MGQKILTEDIDLLLNEAARRASLGHQICSYDDYHWQMFGFLDMTARDWMLCPMRSLLLNPTNAILKSPDGRATYFGPLIYAVGSVVVVGLEPPWVSDLLQSRGIVPASTRGVQILVGGQPVGKLKSFRVTGSHKAAQHVHELGRGAMATQQSHPVSEG